MSSISEIQENYERRKKLLSFTYGISLIVLILLLTTIYYNDLKVVIFPLMLVLLVLALFTSFFIPVLSEYELIRYHLTELINSLSKANFKKSENHLNELAYNIAELNDEFEDNLLLNSTKKTLQNFWALLKYQIYPRIKENDFESYYENLNDINRAITYEGINSLNSNIEALLVEDRDEIEETTLPYENPPFINRIIINIKNKFSVTFHENFSFRLSFLIGIYLAIGYIISTITTLEFNTTFVSTLLLVGLGTAKEMK
ncbi:MAG: hypothetical protein KAT05_06555 [Spirochaetes bacterium]|nr:hypothetical protein [Spirochaetota bacterium]